MEKMCVVLSIDIGILNMGVSMIDYDDESPQRPTCRFAQSVDITVWQCGPSCHLRHERHVVDWMDHFMLAYQWAYGEADVVLVERQPPGGLRCAEALLLAAWRDKVVLVQPRSFHHHFGIGHLSYDGRKQAVVRLAQSLFCHCPVAQAALADDARVHDIADSMLFVVFYIAQQQQQQPPLAAAPAPPIIEDVDRHFARFAYRGRRRRRGFVSKQTL